MIDLIYISLVTLFVFGTRITGCNTTDTAVESTKKLTAHKKIVDYAVNNSKTAPTVEDYTNAGITGVNTTNLATVNDALKTLALQSYPKARAKIQAIVTPGDTTPGNTELGATETKIAMSVIATYALDNTKTAPTSTDYTNAGIKGVTATNVASLNAQLDNLVSLFTDDVVTKVQAVVNSINGDTTEILKKIGNEHQDHNATITVAQLQSITPPLNDINSSYENIYQTYIASADSNISSPATRAEVQRMIDALRLSKLGAYNTDGFSIGVTLSSDGTKAYIADGRDGLVIVDISDPSHPIKLGTYNTAGHAYSVTLSSNGQKAYIADWENGLVIVDVSDPAHPTKLGSYNTAGLSHNLTLSSDGTKAYVADEENGLVIIDVSDPTHPTKFGSYDRAGYTEDVTLSNDGTKAYLADYQSGLVIVDITDPAHPTKLGSYSTAGYSWGVTLSSDGTKAYIADDDNGLVIVDISDPSHATKLGSYDIDEHDAYAFDVTLSSDGTKAYVAAYKGGLVIVDISDPAHPTKLDSYNAVGYYNYTEDVTLSSDGTKAYIADSMNGLVIIGGIK